MAMRIHPKNFPGLLCLATRGLCDADWTYVLPWQGHRVELMNVVYWCIFNCEWIGITLIHIFILLYIFIYYVYRKHVYVVSKTRHVD